MARFKLCELTFVSSQCSCVRVPACVCEGAGGGGGGGGGGVGGVADLYQKIPI